MNKQEITDALKSSDNSILKKANEVRFQYKGDEVHLRGLIEFSNICKRNCLYCGLRGENSNVKRYRLLPDEIIKIAKNGSVLGYKTVVLQSGEDDFYDVEKMTHIISEIKKFNLAITLSIGEKTYDEYKAYKEAGADRFLLRIETTDKNLYEKMHPKASFENRIKCLYNLKELGYETGTGSLVGLPNQTIDSLADDILFYKKLDADMVGIGPFIPHPDTPLAGGINEANFNLALRMMAITRILMPDINIPATTAMETINRDGRKIALQSGANVVMPNITTEEYRAKYEIYPGKICVNESPDVCRKCIENKIKAIGRSVSLDFGFRK